VNNARPRDNIWRGIFAIPVTPFAPSGGVDHQGLRRQVEFCVGGGARGLVYPGVVSEFFALDHVERRAATEAVIKAAAGAVPVVAGVTSSSGRGAARAAADAEELGAAGVMATLPYVQHLFTPDDEFVNEYFASIAAACSLPIILQNARIGHQIAIGRLAGIVDANPRIRYIKEETNPSTHRLSEAIEAVGDRLDGVFAGLGGVFLMSELDRGAVGSMPAPPFVDVLSRAFDLYAAGDRAEARARLEPLSRLFTFELLYNLAIIKEVLYRRGVISSVTCRTPVPRLDAVDLRELDELLADVDFAALAA
jgi:dihydrodipicolinate synthase/N-acetylneuraminate lyase